MGLILVLNESGDERIEWDPDDAAQVRAANKEFKRLKKDGYLFYEVQETKGRKVDRFDKKLGKLVAAPGGQTTKDKTTGTRSRAMSGGPVAAASTTVW